LLHPRLCGRRKTIRPRSAVRATDQRIPNLPRDSTPTTAAPSNVATRGNASPAA